MSFHSWKGCIIASQNKFNELIFFVQNSHGHEEEKKKEKNNFIIFPFKCNASFYYMRLERVSERWESIAYYSNKKYIALRMKTVEKYVSKPFKHARSLFSVRNFPFDFTRNIQHVYLLRVLLFHFRFYSIINYYWINFHRRFEYVTQNHDQHWECIWINHMTWFCLLFIHKFMHDVCYIKFLVTSSGINGDKIVWKFF